MLSTPGSGSSIVCADDDAAMITAWHTAITSAIDSLGVLAGTTETEFLQIGSQLQDFHQRSSEITALANRLVESVSGDQVHVVISRLRQIMSDMEAYLANARMQSRKSCDTLSRITLLLDQVSQPLEGFQKMTKVLRMLGISTKIESSRLGEMGTGFLALAMDVEKLSQMVNEKSAAILEHRRVLASKINHNLQLVQLNESAQDAKLTGILSSTSASLEDLVAVNSRCSSFGAMISSVSSEVSANISEVVASMQMHDMTRQQMEHIMEALQRLLSEPEQQESDGPDRERLKNKIIDTGNTCELQSAQLKHATSELNGSIISIIANLREVADKQSLMTGETFSTTGIVDSDGGSFTDTISNGLATVTGVLATCAQADRDMAATLQQVAETMQEITGFVADIQDIGSEINLIALNAQIKAAHTGNEGAALGVLAEAIKRLSVEAVNQTGTLSEILLLINSSTTHLFSEATEETEQISIRMQIMENDLGAILAALAKINENLGDMLNRLRERVEQLTEDVAHSTGGIDVHTRVCSMSAQIVSALDRVVEQARRLEPAGSEFGDELLRMEERYTMESERFIHQSITNRQAGAPAASIPSMDTRATPSSGDTSGFGHNVDLF